MTNDKQSKALTLWPMDLTDLAQIDSESALKRRNPEHWLNEVIREHHLAQDSATAEDMRAFLSGLGYHCVGSHYMDRCGAVETDMADSFRVWVFDSDDCGDDIHGGDVVVIEGPSEDWIGCSGADGHEYSTVIFAEWETEWSVFPLGSLTEDQRAALEATLCRAAADGRQICEDVTYKGADLSELEVAEEDDNGSTFDPSSLLLAVVRSADCYSDDGWSESRSAGEGLRTSGIQDYSGYRFRPVLAVCSDRECPPQAHGDDVLRFVVVFDAEVGDFCVAWPSVRAFGG